MLNEPGKHIGKPWIEPAGIDGHSNVNEDVRAATRPVAGRAVRMASVKPIEESGSNEEVVNQGVDDNETRPDVEPAGSRAHTMMPAPWR